MFTEAWLFMAPDIIIIPGMGIIITRVMQPGDLVFTIIHGQDGDSRLELALEDPMVATACGVPEVITEDTGMDIIEDTAGDIIVDTAEVILREPSEAMRPVHVTQIQMYIITEAMVLNRPVLTNDRQHRIMPGIKVAM